MSPENAETAHSVVRAVTQRDRAALLNLTDPEIEWSSFFAALGAAGAYHGHEGIRQYLRDIEEAFDSFEGHLDDVLHVGDIVVGVGRIYYRGKASGVETDVSAGWVFRFRSGKLIYLRAFSEPERTLARLGLRE